MATDLGVIAIASGWVDFVVLRYGTAVSLVCGSGGSAVAAESVRVKLVVNSAFGGDRGAHWLLRVGGDWLCPDGLSIDCSVFAAMSRAFVPVVWFLGQGGMVLRSVSGMVGELG